MSGVSFSVVVSVGDDGAPVVAVQCELCQASLAMDEVHDHVRDHRRADRIAAPPAPVAYRLVFGPTPSEPLGVACRACTEIVSPDDVDTHAERHWDEGPR